MSYDPPKVLSAFASDRGIEFPLLSDPFSKTIDAWGVRNEQAPPRVDGIPHPGTFLLDETGVIRAKLFREGYKKRHSPDEILAAAAALD